MKEKKTNITTIRWEDSLYKEIEKYALQEHRSVSEFIRHTAQVYIERIKEIEAMRK